MLLRTLEPEVMDSENEARDYDAMDHAEVNGRFVDDLLERRPAPARVLDVGTGTARIPIELCKRAPRVRVVGIDLADEMLALARKNVEAAGLGDRIALEKRDAKSSGFSDGAFDVTISNTLLHHLPEPAGLLGEMWRLTAKGGLLFVRDLVRPRSETEIHALVTKHGGAPASDDIHVVASHDRQKGLLAASLHAGLTLEEIRELAAALGIPASGVTMTSDRHWTLAHVKP